MPGKKSDAPGYRYHISGQAVVTLDGKNFYLGPHDSPESKARYFALLNEYHANGKRMPENRCSGPALITIQVLCADYREHIVQQYANSPQETHRLGSLCTLLESEYGSLPADQFGPRKLAEIRDTLVASGNCRTYVNRLIRCVKRIFRHAVSRELIGVEVLIRLNTLEPLKRGQTVAPETLPVRPVGLDSVRATAGFLSPTLTAMVRIQASTGMRPSELCNMRPIDIVTRTDGVWMYRPPKHKTSHRGIAKAIPLVADARQAIEPFLDRSPEDYCFSPRDSMDWFRSQQKRVTPLSCGNRPGTNRKAEPKKQPGVKYSPSSYRRAITRAAVKAKVPH